MKTLQSTLKFFRTWCKSRDIEFVSSSATVVPHAVFDRNTGRKIIYMPLISAVNFDEWQRQGYHESSHLAPDNIWHYEVMYRLSMRKGMMLHDISNCLVDNLAERVDFHEYRGRAEVLSSGRADYAEKLGAIMRKNTLDPRHLLTSALLKWDTLNREKWMMNFVFPPSHESLPHLDELYNKTKAIRLDYIIDRIAERGNSETNISELVELVCEIDSWIHSENGNKPQPQKGSGEEGDDADEQGAEETSEDSNGTEGNPADGTEDASQGDAGSEEGQDQASQAGGDSADSGEEEGADPGSRAGEDNEPGDKGANEQQGSASGSGGESQHTPTPTESDPQNSESEGNTFNPHDQGANITRVRYTQEEADALDSYNQDVNREIGDDMAPSANHAVEEMYKRGVKGAYIPCTEQRLIRIEKGGSFKQARHQEIMRTAERSSLDRQVRKHLQLRSAGRTVHGVKRGRLSPKNLHRLYHGGSQIQPAVFKRSEHGKVKTDSAVSLLIDMSGSMGCGDHSSKYNLAAASAMSFAEVLNGLRIRHEVIGFTHSPGTNTLYLLKEFNEKPLTKTVMAEKLSSTRIHQDHNADGEALQTTAERLMRMNEKNKVMMVLSDGQPNGYWKGNGKAYLRLVVDDIENHSPIHLCAIGIKTSAVSQYYTNYQVISNIDELSGAVLETLKNNLLTL